MKNQITKDKPYLVLSYEVCFKCCLDYAQRDFGISFTGSDGPLVWELQGEEKAWSGFGPFRCPCLGDVAVVRCLDKYSWKAVDEEIPKGCVYYLEQFLLSKRYYRLREVRKAYREMVRKRHK